MKSRLSITRFTLALRARSRRARTVPCGGIGPGGADKKWKNKFPEKSPSKKIKC